MTLEEKKVCKGCGGETAGYWRWKAGILEGPYCGGCLGTKMKKEEEK